ncbi:MAG: MATE family efflux transporter [Lachnospiraceae bacterium]|nr:MATE family efflux transporter [Lachnospiraceae bacterium]
MEAKKKDNALGTESIPKLMTQFAIPSIIAMIVGALYNIIDQFFIGQEVGTLGNAATNIAFPLSTSCLAVALMFGIGGASCFNLALGKGDKKSAPYYMGNALVMLTIIGIVMCIVSEIFLIPMLNLFGAPKDVLPYAKEYVRITAIGFPFQLLITGGGHLMRADGSPRMTMFSNLIGAVINTILDALFVIGFGWGMKGAAAATVIGQVFSALIVISYMTRTKTVKLELKHLRLRFKYLSKIMSIGLGSFFNQIAMMIVQIVLNNSLKYYGALSIYGSSIPIASSGIVMKVSQLSLSVVIGIAQGSQPIESYNYGAGKYHRVKKAYGFALLLSGIVSVVSFLAFFLLPRQILSLFGKGTEEYFTFGINYFRIYLFFTWLNFLQPVTTTLFTSIGKSIKGVFLSLTRQIIFLLPLIAILPMISGINGLLYAGPIADMLAAIVAVLMATREFKKMQKEELIRDVVN